MTRWWGIVQVQANLLGLHGPRLEKKNASDNLKAVGDAMLHFLQQDFLLAKQIVFFPLSTAAVGYVFYRQ
jgi:hypothetical protein